MGSSKLYSNGYWKLYVHINLSNDKRYVGITFQKPEYRWNHGESYKSNPHFYSAIKKYGWDGFAHIVLFDYLTEEEAKDAEIYYIDLWQTQNREYGYNVSAGGESSSGYHPPPELVARLAEMHRGAKRSEETKKKMSASTAFRRPEVRKLILEKRKKKVSAYTLNDEYVDTFDSSVDAANILGLTDAMRKHISDCCKEKGIIQGDINGNLHNKT